MSQTVDLGSRFLEATRHEGVLRVVFNRPERRNAMTDDMWRGITQAVHLADQDPTLDALVLTGTGDVFCAGGDMSEPHHTDDPQMTPQMLLPFEHIERCSKLVVAVVNGLCQAGGLILALCADISLASDRATFRAPQLLRGIADTLVSARLVHQVGLARARYLLFTAARIDATEAERIGLVSRVAPAAELEAQLGIILDQIRATGPAARTLLKRDLYRQLPIFDWAPLLGSLTSPETAEGVRAFLEKRPPRWPR